MKIRCLGPLNFNEGIIVIQKDDGTHISFQKDQVDEIDSAFGGWLLREYPKQFEEVSSKSIKMESTEKLSKK